jgi:hypothetical protein
MLSCAQIGEIWCVKTGYIVIAEDLELYTDKTWRGKKWGGSTYALLG